MFKSVAQISAMKNVRVFSCRERRAEQTAAAIERRKKAATDFRGMSDKCSSFSKYKRNNNKYYFF